MVTFAAAVTAGTAEAEVGRWHGGGQRELVLMVDRQVVVQLGQVTPPEHHRGPPVNKK